MLDLGEVDRLSERITGNERDIIKVLHEKKKKRKKKLEKSFYLQKHVKNKLM